MALTQAKKLEERGVETSSVVVTMDGRVPRVAPNPNRKHTQLKSSTNIYRE